MVKAKGLQYSIRVTDKDIRLSRNTFMDASSQIDPIIEFENLVGFHYKRATLFSGAGYGYLQLQTWNPRGYINDADVATGFMNSIYNRNHLKFSMPRNRAFARVVVRLKEIVDLNESRQKEWREKDLEYRIQDNNKIAETLSKLPNVTRPTSYYGFWVDWS